MAIKNNVERRRSGKGFSYYDHDELINDKEQIRYFKSLRIPPAWNNVKIAKNQKSRILAIGNDSAGRMQYIYHPAFRARQEKEKFNRILRFARALPQMRQTTNSHLSHSQLDYEKVLACIVQLMDQAYFRVGNEVYAKQNQSYGLTTIRSKHTTITGNTIVFDYIGKSGQHQLKKVTDRRLARIVKQLDDLPGYEVFKYYDDGGNLKEVNSQDVNTYIKEIMGEEFSAKDFRTWGGTLLAAGELANADWHESEEDRKKVVSLCVQRVAQRLGNTPAIARASYIDPRIINSYVRTNELAKVRQTVEAIEDMGELTADEHCVLVLLEKSTV